MVTAISCIKYSCFGRGQAVNIKSTLFPLSLMRHSIACSHSYHCLYNYLMPSTAGLVYNTETTEADNSEDASAITPLLVGTEQPHQTSGTAEEEGTAILFILLYKLTLLLKVDQQATLLLLCSWQYNTITCYWPNS